MNLVIDSGNTRVKWAVFSSSSDPLKRGVYTLKEGVESLQASLSNIEKVIISDVSGKIEKEMFSVPTDKIILLNAQTQLPIELNYETLHTLGNDRIAAAVGAHAQFLGKNVLVIDAGTCITVDLVDKNGVYQGGTIAPGFQMKLNAMHHFTGKLPQLAIESETELLGKSTKDCMLSGAINFTWLEIDAVIQRYKENYEDLSVVLTGGDTEFLAKGLKSSTFADLFLVEKGLNEILRFNF